MVERNFGHERRRRDSDRRQSNRPGKYDRRKNTCGICQFFKPQDTNAVAGLCLKHQSMIRAEDFACVWFVPAQVPDRRPAAADERPGAGDVTDEETSVDLDSAE